MRDSGLRQGTRRRARTWADQKRQFRALRVPDEVVDTIQPWAGAPDKVQPLLRLVREIFFSNAVHRARTKSARVVAGAARDPHYKQRPEQPGVLSPLLKIVDRVVADLERLIDWKFTPPIERHEVDAKLRPTGRIVHLSRLDETLRAVFERARTALMPMQAELREATRRRRGRKAVLVHPFPVSALGARTAPPTPARRRELEQRLREELLQLHPARQTRPQAARAEVGRLARRIIRAIL